MDTQFVESDFYDLLQGVLNYESMCERAQKESLLEE